MNRQGQKFVIWFRDSVALTDYKTMMFFNRHALFSKNIWFIEFYSGGALPANCESPQA